MERLQSAGPKFCPVDGAHLSAAISVILVGHKCNYRWCWGFLSFKWMVVAFFVFKGMERGFCKCIGWVFLKMGYRLIPHLSFVPPSHKRQFPNQPDDPFEMCALSSQTGKSVMLLVWHGYLTIIDSTFAKKKVCICVSTCPSQSCMASESSSWSRTSHDSWIGDMRLNCLPVKIRKLR